MSGQLQLKKATFLVDEDNNIIDSVLVGTTRRLAVDAVISGLTLDEDTDDDLIASGQTLLATINLNQQFDGTNWRRLQSRGAVAAQAYTLQRTLVDSVLRVDDGTTYSAMAGRGAVAAQAYTLIRGLTDSVVRGDDGTTYSAVGSRAAVAAQAYSLQRLLVDGVIRVDDGTTYSAMAGRGAVAAQAYTFIRGLTDAVVRGDDGATYSAIASRAAVAAQAYTVVRACTDAVIRGDDGTTYSAVAARNFDVPGDVVSTLIGLLVNARPSVFDERTAEWNLLLGTSHASVGSTVAETSPGAFVYQPRESAFAASRRGRRFYITHQTPDTVITGQTSFVATTPTFLLRSAAASVRVILRSITLHQTGTAAGAEVKITVAIDTADRLSVGGTAVVGQNGNTESSNAIGIGSFLTNPTATAAGAGTRYIVNTGMAASVGSTLTVEFKDGILMGATGSVAVYTWAATTAPSWFFTWEIEIVA